VRTTSLIEALEREAMHSGLVAADLHARGPLARRRALGVSPRWRLREEIALVAGLDLTVLVTGETGVGQGADRAAGPRRVAAAATRPSST
jgi:anaerobic nitric oxide reductase transcription regulator